MRHGYQPEDPRTEEKDEFEQETASPLPTREAMSIIDPTLGPKIYEPPDGFSTDQGISERDPDA